MKEGLDIKAHDLSVVALPEGRLVMEGSRVADYWELTKPRLTFLVLVTTLIGFCMGSNVPLDWFLLFHTIFGTALVAGGAAALNQFMERDFDARMKRTVDRPLPSGRLSAAGALAFGLVLCGVGLWVLAMAVNLLTTFLGTMTVISYLFIYTPLKRKTPFCTLIGAVPGAIPPLMGWSAVNGSLAPRAWVLFGILFFWQMPHFYALAQIYREDYIKGGFPMLSVVDPTGQRISRGILIHTVALFFVSLIPTFLGMTGMIYFLGALFLGLCFLVFGLRAAILRTTASCRFLFLGSIFYLPFLLMLMVVTKLLG